MAEEPNPANAWQSSALAVITWLATSAGLTGLLIAIGYTVYSAHTAFLGLIIYDLTATECLRVAGGFLLGVTLQYITLAGDLWDGITTHWVLVVGALVITGVVAYIARRTSLRRVKVRDVWPRFTGLRPHIGKLATLLMLLSVAKAAYFDLPATRISDVLLSNFECNKKWNLPILIEHRTTELWRNVACSRVEKDINECSCHGREKHLRHLRQGFVAAVSWAGLLVAVSIVLTIWAIRAESREFGGGGFVRAFVVVLGIFSAVNLFMIPYYYGKILYSTMFSLGNVVVDYDEKPIRGYILSVGPDAVTIFSEAMQIESLPRKRIKTIRMGDVKDVVESRIGNKFPPPPPPSSSQ